MEYAGSEWNDRAAWSMLALKGIEEKKTATGQRTVASRHTSLPPFPSLHSKKSKALVFKAMAQYYSTELRPSPESRQVQPQARVRCRVLLC